MEQQLPIYPNFKKITIDEKKFFTDFCKQFPSYSDFNLLSLLSWDATNVNSFSLLNGNLVIKIKDYLSDGFLYSVLGISEIDATITTLISEHKKLSVVPETTVTLIKDQQNISLEEDRDSFDYVLDTSKTEAMVGSEFRHLREDISKFKKLYPNFYLQDLNLKDERIMNEVWKVSNKWVENKKFDSEKKKEELHILESFYKYSTEFNCRHFGLYIDNSLTGYISIELVQGKTAIGHFGCTTNEYECATPMLTYLTNNELAALEFQYFNLEQDAGLKGLREAKMYFNPELFLKKFTITAKS